MLERETRMRAQQKEQERIQAEEHSRQEALAELTAEWEKRRDLEKEQERIQAEEHSRQEALAERLRQIEFQQFQQTHPHMAQQMAPPVVHHQQPKP
ncbi:hypothetical protein T484DRAFT_1788479 [Baffinella frigidus]|nr:hypothetical protein T484DRAFT_1788479 [Cryptophyta sp. CCMP2293]